MGVFVLCPCECECEGAEMNLNPSLAIEVQQKLDEWTRKDTSLAPLIKFSVPATDIERVRDAYRIVFKRQVLGKAVVVWKDSDKINAKL